MQEIFEENIEDIKEFGSKGMGASEEKRWGLGGRAKIEFE